MQQVRSWLFLALAGVVPTLGCGSTADVELVDESVQALNTCEETVPQDRSVDDIPAYAQCETTMDGPIWSNNGIDTSTTSLGPDWVRTQHSGGYQCTELASRYMHFRWNIDYQHGNAGSWCEGQLPPTLVKATTPVHGDLIVFAPGSCGASTTTGHIAVIDTVDSAAAKVTFVEQNRAGRRSANQSCAACFLHAVANDGSSAGAGGAPGASGAPSAGGVAGPGPSTGGAAQGGSAGRGPSPMQAGQAGTGVGGASVSSSGGRGLAPSVGGATGGTSSASVSGGTAASSGGTSSIPPASTAGSGPTSPSTGGAGTVPPTAAGMPSAPGVSGPGPSREDPASCTVVDAPGARSKPGALAWFGAFVAGAWYRRRRAHERRLRLV
jgi:MYXO-CTERM domain-containing protein